MSSKNKQPNADEREAMAERAKDFKKHTAHYDGETQCVECLADFALAVLREREAAAVRAAFEAVRASDKFQRGYPSSAMTEYLDAMDAVQRKYEKGGENDGE